MASQYPKCPTCGVPMRLILSEPHTNLSAFDDRVHACPVCSEVKTSIVDRWTGDAAKTANAPEIGDTPSKDT